ncbi:uncharacterized protein [Watersipora subatra]|uniref:uncharacterized protein n=1 Tax=Watersipora subatra TaxID=2589382 RepID=UPI00355BB73D
MSSKILYGLLITMTGLGVASNLIPPSNCNWTKEDCYRFRTDKSFFINCFLGIGDEPGLCAGYCPESSPPFSAQCKGYCPEYIGVCLSHSGSVVQSSASTSLADPPHLPPDAVDSTISTSLVSRASNTPTNTTTGVEKGVTSSVGHTSSTPRSNANEGLGSSFFSTSNPRHIQSTNKKKQNVLIKKRNSKRKNSIQKNTESARGEPMNIAELLLIVFGSVIIIGCAAVICRVWVKLGRTKENESAGREHQNLNNASYNQSSEQVNLVTPTDQNSDTTNAALIYVNSQEGVA